MNPLRCLLLSSVLLVVPLAPAPAAQGAAWSPDTAVAGLGGDVRCFATWRSELIAGGGWFEPRGGVIRGVARYDGQRWRALGTGMDTFSGSVVPEVFALAEFGGELIAGGTFDTAGGLVTNGIARWNGSAWRTVGLGQGVRLFGGNGEVRALVLYNQELYAAGFFDTIDGQPCAGFARWDGVAWHPVSSGFRDSVSGTVARARCLRVWNNELYVGGAFDRAGGVTARRIAVWNGSAFRALGVGMDADVVQLDVLGTDLIAGGWFSNPVQGIAAWNGGSWRALGSNGPTGPVGVARTWGTALYANFGTQLGRWDGATWNLVGGVAGIHSGFNGTAIYALHDLGSELILGGEFDRAGTQQGNLATVASANVVAFDGATGWRHLGDGLGVNQPIKRLVPFRGGWVAVGDFSLAGAVLSPGVAFYDGTRWSSLGLFDGQCETAVVYRGDLIVSGGFSHINGAPIAGMARFDGSQWQAFGPSLIVPLAVYQNDLYAGGSNFLRRWNGGAWVPVIDGGAPIAKVHVHSDGRLYFTTDTAFSRTVWWWDGVQGAQIGAPNDLVLCLGSYGNDLVLGGRFTAVSGTPANLLARWNGATWSAFTPGVTGYSVNALVTLDGILYAGCSGDPRGYLLRYTGTAWQNLGTGADGVPVSLFGDRATGSVWASGPLLSAGGLPAWHLAEWKTWPQWRNRLHGLAGSGGEPLLMGSGALTPNSPFALRVEAWPQHVGLLVLGRARVDAPVLGGVLVPTPDFVLPMVGDAQGVSLLALTWPAGMPSGLDLFFQTWLVDASAPAGWAASNALQCTTP